MVKQILCFRKTTSETSCSGAARMSFPAKQVVDTLSLQIRWRIPARQGWKEISSWTCDSDSQHCENVPFDIPSTGSVQKRNPVRRHVSHGPSRGSCVTLSCSSLTFLLSRFLQPTSSPFIPPLSCLRERL
eukprot:765334-Hanusia_phi.AAC.2